MSDDTNIPLPAGPTPWWQSIGAAQRSQAHLAVVLADLYPRALSRLLRDRRLHDGDAYEIASRITQRLIREYERGTTYRVHPHVVVGNYCTYLTKEYLAEQRYSRCDSLDATRIDDDSGNAVPIIADIADPMRPIDEQIIDEQFLLKLLAHESLTETDTEVLELRYLEGRDIDEMALMLGIERNAVDQRLHRALKRLRDLSLSA
jgi:RNA polymerase sigma factor (sigma-70 family)